MSSAGFCWGDPGTVGPYSSFLGVYPVPALQIKGILRK